MNRVAVWILGTVSVLFFSPIAAMLYGFFGAQSQPSDARPAQTLAAAGA